GRRRPRQRQHALCELADRDAFGRADVEDLPGYVARVHQPGERANRVLHVAEAARLRAVPVDLERTACERGLDESRDDHAVLAALTRTDRVEEPDDDAVEPTLLVICEREELVQRLRLGVRPAARRRRAVHPLALLR